MNGKQTILVVDDESSIRDMVQLSLELAGFNCLQAANAREAMGQILDARPDLVGRRLRHRVAVQGQDHGVRLADLHR